MASFLIRASARIAEAVDLQTPATTSPQASQHRQHQTPAAAMRDFASALKAGDAASMAAFFSPQGESTKVLRLAAATRTIAGYSLLKSLKKALGSAFVEKIRSNHPLLGQCDPDFWSQLRWSVDEQNGTATAINSELSKPLLPSLIRVDESWCINTESRYRLPHDLDPLIGHMLVEAARWENAASDIAAGKIPDAKKLRIAISGQQPATKPVKLPPLLHSMPVPAWITSAVNDPRKSFMPGTAPSHAFIAINNRNVGDLAKTFWSKNDPNGRLARAVAERVIACTKLMESSYDALGELPPARPFGLVRPADFVVFFYGSWTENGGTAIFRQETEESPATGNFVELRRVAGSWKFKITPMGETVNQAIAATAKQTALVKKVTADLATGQIKTIDQLDKELAGAKIVGVVPARQHHIPDIVPGR